MNILKIFYWKFLNLKTILSFILKKIVLVTKQMKYLIGIVFKKKQIIVGSDLIKLICGTGDNNLTEHLTILINVLIQKFH